MKRTKKFIAILMAAVMIFSIGLVSAFAAEKTYEPQYSEALPVETVEDLLTDGDLVINEMLFKKVVDPIFQKDDLIKTVYSLFPTLANTGLITFAGDPTTVAFYQEKFGDVFHDMTTEPVTAESITAYLAEKDLSVTDQASFFAQLKTILPTLFSATVLGFMKVSSLLSTFLPYINDVLYGMGWGDVAIELSDEAMENEDAQAFTSELCDSVADILNYLHDNPAEKILSVPRSLASEENRIRFTNGLSNLLGAFGTDGDFTGMLGLADILPASLLELFSVFGDAQNELKDPAVGNGTEAYDFAKLANRILEINFFAEGGNQGKFATRGLTVDSINWSNLDGLNEEHLDADTLMVVYNYLYRNLIANEDNFAVIEALVQNLLPDIASYLPLLSSQSPDALLTMAALAVHGIANPVVNFLDKATGVKVSAALPLDSDASLLVKALSDGDAIAEIMAALKDTAAQMKAFDISLTQNGDPMGTMPATVSIPVPEGYDADRVLVYLLLADGTLQAMETTVEEGMASFETNVPGVLVIAEKAQVAAPDTNPTDPSAPDGTDSPKDEPSATTVVDTGDGFVSAMAALTVLAGGALFLTKKHHS